MLYLCLDFLPKYAMMILQEKTSINFKTNQHSNILPNSSFHVCHKKFLVCSCIFGSIFVLFYLKKQTNKQTRSVVCECV